jgi:hypothetical protein
LIPEIADAVGYTSSHRVAGSVTRSAVGDEHGYVVRLPRLTALGP